MSIFASLPRPTTTYHSDTYDRISIHHGFNGRGKTVLIIGGTSGVGRSIAQAFAAAGTSRIAIVSRRAGPQAEVKKALEDEAKAAVQVLTYPAAVTDSGRVAAVLRELGAVDVLVLAAAAVHRRAGAAQLSTGEVREAFETNAVATFDVVRAYLLLAATSGGGGGGKTVINVSSAAAQVSGTLRAGYGASKAAAAQVLQHFAAEEQQQQQQQRGGVGGDGVRIFSFHPGAFYTPSVAGHFARDEVRWDSLALPGHFALWLAGPESGFLHGRHVWANWDVDELIALREKVERDASFLTIGLVL